MKGASEQVGAGGVVRRQHENTSSRIGSYFHTTTQKTQKQKRHRRAAKKGRPNTVDDIIINYENLDFN